MAEKVKKTAKPGVRDIGLDVEAPKGMCKDNHGPYHGQLPVSIQREYMRYIPKFERYEKRTSKYLAHAPPCLQTKLGDEVRIMECRPLSKRVSYVVIENRQ